MDAAVDVLHGPHNLQKTGSVTVPKALLREVGLDRLTGDDAVHWMLNPDIPGTLVLVPSVLVARTMPDVVKSLRKAAR